MIKIAVAKGKLFDEAAELFEKAGISVPDEIRQSRKLYARDERSGRTFLSVRAQDVPTYVSQGAADIGVVGRDVLLEQESDLYQMLDLGIGPCRLVLAGKDSTVLSKNGPLRAGRAWLAG